GGRVRTGLERKRLGRRSQGRRGRLRSSHRGNRSEWRQWCAVSHARNCLEPGFQLCVLLQLLLQVLKIASEFTGGLISLFLILVERLSYKAVQLYRNIRTVLE